MNSTVLNRKLADLTVLEFQGLLDSVDNEETLLGTPPEEIDIATPVCELTVRQLITVLRHDLPRGLPKP